MADFAGVLPTKFDKTTRNRGKLTPGQSEDSISYYKKGPEFERIPTKDESDTEQTSFDDFF